MLKKERKRALELGDKRFQNGAASFTNPSLENQKTYVKEAYKTDNNNDAALTSLKSRVKGSDVLFVFDQPSQLTAVK